LPNHRKTTNQLKVLIWQQTKQKLTDNFNNFSNDVWWLVSNMKPVILWQAWSRSNSSLKPGRN